MTTTQHIATPHGPVTAMIEQPGRPRACGILLAHGAGAGQQHPWMAAMRAALASQGFSTMTFDYAYTEAGRKAPDRLPKLLDVHEAVAAAFASSVGAVVLAGKSMGGRVGGHLVADRGFPAVGIVYLGYPLVAMGKTEPRDTSHLASLEVPQLFISGDRDRLGPIGLVSDVAAGVPAGTLHVIETGDHSLKPLKASGRELQDTVDEAAAAVSRWADGLST